MHNLRAFCLYKLACKAAEEGEPDEFTEPGLAAVAEAIKLAGDEGYGKAQLNDALLHEIRGNTELARKKLVEAQETVTKKLKRYKGSPRLLWTRAIAGARLGEDSLDNLRLAVKSETHEFPVSYWAAREDAFQDLRMKEHGKEFDKILNESRFGEATSNPAVDISGMLWDEDFSSESVEANSTPDPAGDVT